MEQKQRKLPPHLWKPGQSGNPRGRARGCRDKLGEAFVVALYADFLLYGQDAVAKARIEKPSAYLTAISRVLPKEVNLQGDAAAAFLKLLEKITNGMDRSLAEEPGQPEALRDERPAGHA
jgi:hypothetical protein